MTPEQKKQIEELIEAGELKVGMCFQHKDEYYYYVCPDYSENNYSVLSRSMIVISPSTLIFELGKNLIHVPDKKAEWAEF